MEQITLGNVTITRVWEYYGPVEMTPDTFFPESPKEVWDDDASWLAPHFLDSETNIVNSAIQTWLLRSEGRTILVDTGVGNHKDRPYVAGLGPPGHRTSSTSSPRAGVRPEDVDVVVNTHLHVDHVGWNTRLDGRRVGADVPQRHLPDAARPTSTSGTRRTTTSRCSAAATRTSSRTASPRCTRPGRTLLWEDSHTDRREPAPGRGARAHPRLLASLTLASGHRPGGVRRRPAAHPGADRRTRTPTAASARTRRQPAPPAARCSAGPPTPTRSSCPRTSAATAPPRSARDGSEFAIKGWAPFAPYDRAGLRPAERHH